MTFSARLGPNCILDGKFVLGHVGKSACGSSKQGSDVVTFDFRIIPLKTMWRVTSEETDDKVFLKLFFFFFFNRVTTVALD